MTQLLESFDDDLRVVIIGASGGIGEAMGSALAGSHKVTQVFALSRRTAPEDTNPKITPLRLDLTDEDTIAECAAQVAAAGKADLVIVTTGLLHGQDISPEKNMRAINHDNFLKSFEVNTVGPALCAKHFIPLLRRDRKTIFTALSARVGSISDNRLGGWYAYRASKAALNMVLKTVSIETGRTNSKAIICGLHPGTVATDLSKPFQSNVPDGKLFTPEFSAHSLINVLDGLTSEDSGSLFAWDGKRIEF